MGCGWSTSERGVEGGLLEGMVIGFCWFGGRWFVLRGQRSLALFLYS